MPQINGDLIGNNRSCGVRRSLGAIDMVDNVDVSGPRYSAQLDMRILVLLAQKAQRLGESYYTICNSRNQIFRKHRNTGMRLPHERSYRSRSLLRSVGVWSYSFSIVRKFRLKICVQPLHDRSILVCDDQEYHGMYLLIQ